MKRSQIGLEAAGEWHILKKMLPNLKNKTVLDLGCGFGWHCIYAMENSAKSVIGIDISEKMLDVAKKKTKFKEVEYVCLPIEDIDFPENSFDVVISSLTFHYIKSFKDICAKVHKFLKNGGYFVFSVEHPVFTAYGTEDWYYDSEGKRLHWPVDNYFSEGIRKTNFLGEEVLKYHKTLTTYVNTLLQSGFEIKELVEPEPAPQLLKTNPNMQNELRRPMMLLVSARKKCSLILDEVKY